MVQGPIVAVNHAAEPPSGTAFRPVSRLFAVDVLTCPHCGGARRLIAMITDGLVVRRILDHLELPSSPPLIAPARAPPELEFAW